MNALGRSRNKTGNAFIMLPCNSLFIVLHLENRIIPVLSHLYRQEDFFGIFLDFNIPTILATEMLMIFILHAYGGKKRMFSTTFSSVTTIINSSMQLRRELLYWKN